MGPLVLAPFRGLRYDAEQVGDLGSVVSPPYDMLDAETVRELERGSRHNIVRLILSRHFDAPYVAVRERLDQWRAEGRLRPDPDPALYLYEYTVAGAPVRGLVGLVGLRGYDERVVLPHEDVMPEPLQDRTSLMRTTSTNLEPILLLHRSSSELRVLTERISGGVPLLDVTNEDSRHRLWAETDPGVLSAIGAELLGGQALIADGHHRYAAYLRLQADQRDPDAPPETSPWDYGLAMLVDQESFSPGIGPIHRSVDALTLPDVEDLLDGVSMLVRARSREDAFARHQAVSQERGTAEDAVTVFVVSDGRAWAVLTTPRTDPVDSVVLHELLPRWHVAEAQIGYHHSLDQALRTVSRRPGVVIAVTPPTVAQVHEAAARGRRLPRKSTSFAPKPSMGLVMRDLRDEVP